MSELSDVNYSINVYFHLQGSQGDERLCSINRIIPSDKALNKVAVDSVHCS